MAYDRLAREAIQRGTQFLLTQQATDGFWRDYELRIGEAEAWTTSWVGMLLAKQPCSGVVRFHLQRARRAVLASCTPFGWGYHRRVGADADSTAWALRFLSVFHDVPPGSAERLLGAFIDTSGQVHTFVELAAGAWSGSHADVTPVVGLALVETGARPELIHHIRQAVLRAHTFGIGWPSYWWETAAYGNARSLEFLRSTGGIPHDIRDSQAEWVATAVAKSALETAWLLDIAVLAGLNEAEVTVDLLARLLSSQQSDGGWPASSHLMVPARSDRDSVDPGPFADVRRSVTTAGVVGALYAWLARRSTKASTIQERIAATASRQG